MWLEWRWEGERERDFKGVWRKFFSYLALTVAKFSQLYIYVKIYLNSHFVYGLYHQNDANIKIFGKFIKVLCLPGHG